MSTYNSSYTGAEIDAGILAANTALKSVEGTADQVVVTNNDTISLATAVTDSLALADTALQSITGTTDEIDVSGSTVSLATAVTDSLALADTATQPADIANMVESDVSSTAGASAITNIMSLTQAQYDAITPDASTFYVITA